ncbi:MAG: PRC-barrel domain-containing protein [Ferruginibacter sp.]
MSTSVLNTENLTGVNTEGKSPNRPLKFLTATSIIGDKVFNDQDEHMGTIEEIMLDITRGQVEYVVIKFGGFLTINEKYFAIPFSLLKVDPSRRAFILNQSKEMIEKAPGFDMNQWPETNFHPEEKYWNVSTPG